MTALSALGAKDNPHTTPSAEFLQLAKQLSSRHPSTIGQKCPQVNPA
jgi:hypothetical protein